MDSKPSSMSVKEFIIRNMSTKENIPERVIENVINHQFTSAYKAIERTYSLEFSGFGKFYFNRKKAKLKMEKFLRMKTAFENMLKQEGITDNRRHSVELKLKIVEHEIEVLKPKIHD